MNDEQGVTRNGVRIPWPSTQQEDKDEGDVQNSNANTLADSLDSNGQSDQNLVM